MTQTAEVSVANGQTLRWHSEGSGSAPRRVMWADDTMSADKAWHAACEGTALAWKGDFQNARLLLIALGRRADRSAAPSEKRKPARVQPSTPAERFHRYRMLQAQRARSLGMLLVPVDASGQIPLRRAPDVHEAIIEALGPVCTDASADAAPLYVPLREVLGMIGAHEWRRRGIALDVLSASIHPHYGVFAPVRSEYLSLVARAPLPVSVLQGRQPAWDIGTGTGVLAALLARRGASSVVATETSPRALECAHDNLDRLGLGAQVQVQACDLFPAGQAGLVVCNPPWLPGKPASVLDAAIYDADGRMLRGFLAGLRGHLADVPDAEGWLILSDLAEHFGLRTRADLLQQIDAGGLRVIERIDIRPVHKRAIDAQDPLHDLRHKEVTSLWRLAARRD